MKITTIGLDVAKNVFHVVSFDEHFKERSKKMLRRHQVLKYFANIPVCYVAMEA
ncbi:MAG: IS110 family transposase, partial [Deltaproteobacteria bacterium]|nr:IS110 family transposase [Deltaproteobacteria bacterium]